jgi:hemoglobin
VALSSAHFEGIGGRRGIRRLVRAFYRCIELEPSAAEILKMHSDLAAARARLELFLVEWLGGPKSYSKARGTSSLRARHFFFRVGSAERDAWLHCMRVALEQTVSDIGLRAELEAAFARTAEEMVNRDS